MRHLRFRIIAAAVALAAIPFYAAAQEAAPTPPKLERIDEGEQPAVIIRKPQTEKEITEKRDHGQVTEIKVKSGRSTYYLHPNDQSGGSATAGGTRGNSVRPPEWVVHEFDITPPKKDDKEESTEPIPAIPAPPK